MKKILLKLIKNIFIFENIKLDILDYVRPNRREVCYKSTKCNDKFHCKSVSGKCKLLVNKENLITHKSNKETYISILVEDLLRYEGKRKEILDNEMDNIIDKTKIDYSSDLVNFSSNNPKKLNEELEKYFKNNKEIFISNKLLYDEIESKSYDVNRQKYELFRKDYEIEMFLEPLVQLWEVMLDSYSLYSPPNKSIFNVVRDMLFSRNLKDDSVVIETTKKIRDKVVNYLKDANLEFLNYFNNQIKIQPNKLTKKDNLDIFKVKVYNILNEKISSKADVIEVIYKTITDTNYNGNIFDAFILSQIYNINIIMLMKRRRKDNTDHELITPMKKKIDEYIITLSSNFKNKKIYESVIKKDKSGFRFIFEKKEMPVEFTDYVLVKGAVRTNEYANYNSNEDENSE